MSGVSANQSKGDKNSKSKYSAVKINDLFKVSSWFGRLSICWLLCLSHRSAPNRYLYTDKYDSLLFCVASVWPNADVPFVINSHCYLAHRDGLCCVGLPPGERVASSRLSC